MWSTTGPCGVNCTPVSYVTFGRSWVVAAPAAGMPAASVADAARTMKDRERSTSDRGYSTPKTEPPPRRASGQLAEPAQRGGAREQHEQPAGRRRTQSSDPACAPRSRPGARFPRRPRTAARRCSPVALPARLPSRSSRASRDRAAPRSVLPVPGSVTTVPPACRARRCRPGRRRPSACLAAAIGPTLPSVLAPSESSTMAAVGLPSGARRLGSPATSRATATIASPTAVPPLIVSAVERAVDERRGRRSGRSAPATLRAERDDADAGRRAAAASTQPPRRRLRGGEAVGLDVGRRHRARAVDREHDGRLRSRS